MVYTSRSIGGQEVAADAVEQDVNHGSEKTVHQGLHPRRFRHGGAVPTLRDQPADRLQMGQPFRVRRPDGPAGTVEAPKRVLARDRDRDHRGAPRVATAAPVLGRQEAAHHPDEAAPDGPVAGPVDRLRPAGTPRPDRAEATTDLPGPRRPARPVDGRTERYVVHRFQRRVQDRGWAVLLPADGHRWLQPLHPRMSGPPLHGSPRRQARAAAPVPRVRTPHHHPLRQWSALRDDSHRTAEPPLHLVDSPRHPP